MTGDHGYVVHISICCYHNTRSLDQMGLTSIPGLYYHAENHFVEQLLSSGGFEIIRRLLKGRIRNTCCSLPFGGMVSYMLFTEIVKIYCRYTI